MSGRALSGRTLARNSLLNILGMALPLLAALAAVPALSRGLGAARLGVLSLAWAVLGLFAEFGVGRATTKFVAEVLGAGERKRLAPIVWTTVAGQLAVGLALGVAIAVATPVLVGSALKVPPTLVGEARTSFFVIAAAIPAILLASCFRGVLEAAQRFDLVNAIRVPTTLANYLLPLVGVALGWRLPGVMLLLLAARLASVAAFWLAGWVIFPELRVRPRLDGGELRRVLSFGGWSTVSSIASPVLIYVDRFILAALAGMAAVAYYAVPFELVNRLLIIPGAVAATLFPAFSAVSGRSLAETDELASRALKYILCLLGPLLVIIAAGAHDLLALWIGSEYAQAGAMALRLLAVGVAVNALAHVPHALLMGRGREDRQPQAFCDQVVPLAGVENDEAGSAEHGSDQEEAPRSELRFITEVRGAFPV